MLDSIMMSSPQEISDYYLAVQSAVRIVSSKSLYESMTAWLCNLRDITPTLARLGNGEVLDDIELFEIKHLAMLSLRVRDALLSLHVSGSFNDDHLPIPEDVTQVVDILDPDFQRVASFYVYDSYDAELAAARKALRETAPEDRAVVENKVSELEYRVRKDISRSLRDSHLVLSGNLAALADLDIVMAKAKQMEDKGYIIPKILAPLTPSQYEGLYHPYVKALLEKEGKTFQPVDVQLTHGPTMLIGVNMGGKSVVLKMLGLVQYLMQFGFALPCTCAQVSPREQVLIVNGDPEHTDRGLSSFAGEIEAISEVLRAARSRRNILALIDEPARTTNPTEGTALVSALVTTLSQTGTASFITTHYDTPATKCHVLRVKGYADGKMDYSLVEASSEGVPHEAIDTARRLGADPGWLDLARRLIDNR